MNYLELLKLALPETAVVIAAFAVILVDFMALRGQPVPPWAAPPRLP
jgi:hypothetical protein